MSFKLLDVIRSLSFTNDQRHLLHRLSDADWRALLPLTDRSQLTLPLGIRCWDDLPEWVQTRIGGNLANNAKRQQRIAEAYEQAAEALSSRSIEFVVLKGATHVPLYCDELRYRPQYDLDLFCPANSIEPAYRAIASLGYEPFGDPGRSVVDHLPPMIRKTGWRPKGDYYDPEMPVTIEIHFRFWDAATERFEVQGADGFWNRRAMRKVNGGPAIPALDPMDGLSYATWHLLRHLLRGDAKAYHIYEIAHFLERTAANDEFWRDWRDARPSPLAESVAFRLAMSWFECRANPVVQELTNALPSRIKRWFDLFTFSPALALDRPNKDELFLHFCLVQGLRDRIRVAERRLFPLSLKAAMLDAHVAAPNLGLRLKRRIFGAWFLSRRALHHVRALLPVMWNGFRWRRALVK